MSHASGVVTGKTLLRLRARDAKEQVKVERAAERKAKRERHAGTRERFESFIDTSAGPAGCHLWCGDTQTNHDTRPDIKRYEVGVYALEGYGQHVAHRLQVMLAFDLPSISPDIDIAPKCGNHLCLNIDHLVVREHCGKDRVVLSIPVCDFFCGEVAKDAGRKDLERQADQLLAA